MNTDHQNLTSLVQDNQSIEYGSYSLWKGGSYDEIQSFLVNLSETQLSSCLNKSFKNGIKPLHVTCSRNTKNETKKILDMLFTQYRDYIDVNVQTKSGFTPLQQACAKGNEHAVNLLLDHPKIDIELLNNNKNNALHIAARAGNATIISLLSRVYQNLEQRGQKGRTPLKILIDNKKWKSVSILISNANIDIQYLINSPYNEAIFKVLIHLNQISLIETLIQYIEHSQKQELFISASAEDNPVVMNFLLQNYGDYVKLNAQNKSEETALHKACMMGSYHAAQFLLSQPGIDPYIMCYVYAPLTLACLYGRKKIVELFIFDYNIDVNQLHRGNTILFYISSSSMFFLNAPNRHLLPDSLNQKKQMYYQVIQCLLSHPRVKINSGGFGDTRLSPLHRIQDVEIAKLFLSHPRIDVNIRNSQGMTPLHNAIRSRALIKVQLLLEHPLIDVNKPCPLIGTPLHLAFRLGFVGIAQELLNHRLINIHKKNDRGETPYQVACKEAFGSRPLNHVRRDLQDAFNNHPQEREFRSNIATMFNSHLSNILF